MRTPLQPSAPAGLGRRTLLKGLGLGGVAAAVPGLAACTTNPAPPPAPDPAGSPSAAPTESTEITAAGVQRGLSALPDIIAKDLGKTGVPGLAVVVVYQGEIRYLEGFGVRQVGKPEKVDADTVFQLASVSKPISSSVVAAAFTKKLTEVGWDDPIVDSLPDFTLADRWVGAHVTAADMFAHRSGLPDHSGNLLEDLGYDRKTILDRQRFYPLRPFRATYDYTNYGLTAGGEAIAVAAGTSWEALARDVLFDPLGMDSASFRFSDLEKRSNRAAMHAKVAGKYVPDLEADYDAQAPAGSASSSIRDLAKWVSMLLAQGKPIIEPDQLKRVWLPAIVRPGLPEIGKSPSFYGLGWNVNYESTGELRASHSGAFGRGAATAVTVYPSKGLGIAVITNAAPIGLPEAIVVEFGDFVRYGRSTQEDWLAVIGPYVTPEVTKDQKKYSKPAVDPKPAKALTAYTGRYRNRLYGDLTMSVRAGELSFTIGPAGRRFALRHYSGDEFFFRTTGEDDSGFSGALFSGSRRIDSLTVNAWNKEGLGTFTRV